MRPDIIDEETGERVSFRDFKDYRKLIHLMGKEPDCDTRAGMITVWRDSSPQPSYDEIEAVLDQDVDDAEESLREDSVSFEDPMRKMARVMFTMYNQIRALESKQPVTWKQFIKGVKKL